MINHKAYYRGGKVVIVLNDGRSMSMNMLPNQYGSGISSLSRGENINDAFSFLTADEREFLLLGLTEQWNDIFLEE